MELWLKALQSGRDVKKKKKQVNDSPHFLAIIITHESGSLSVMMSIARSVFFFFLLL